MPNIGKRTKKILKCAMSSSFVKITTIVSSASGMNVLARQTCNIVHKHEDSVTVYKQTAIQNKDIPFSSCKYIGSAKLLQIFHFMYTETQTCVGQLSFSACLKIAWIVSSCSVIQHSTRRTCSMSTGQMSCKIC